MDLITQGWLRHLTPAESVVCLHLDNLGYPEWRPLSLAAGRPCCTSSPGWRTSRSHEHGGHAMAQGSSPHAAWRARNRRAQRKAMGV
jgi:hypothetical protein